MYEYEDIVTVHLEVTDKCNAACPQCARSQDGGPVNPLLPLVDMRLNAAKKIFDPDFLKRIKFVYACGNYGDPVMAPDLVKIFEYFREHNPNLRLGVHTNGGLRRPEWWAELAKMMPRDSETNLGYVRFGIDGLEDTNHIYRRNVKWPILMRNVKAFIDAGGRAEWDFLVFRHNEHQVEEARALAKEMGFKAFYPKATSRFLDRHYNYLDSTVVRNREGKVIGRIERPLNPEWRNDALEEIPDLDRAYGSMHNYMDSAEIDCKVSKNKSIYINPEGLVFPCCYVARLLYLPLDILPARQIKQLVDDIGGKDVINAKYHSIKDILDGPLFYSIVESWSEPTIACGKMHVCARVCGKKFKPNAVQTKEDASSVFF